MIFLVRSPLATAVATGEILRTWLVRLLAIRLTLSVRSFQMPGRARHPRLTAQLALGAHLAGDPGHPSPKADSGSTIVLTVVTSSRISPLASTVIFLDRSPRATAVVTSAMLRTWMVRLFGHEVDGLGEVLPGAGDPLHLGLAAQDALGAHLPGDPGHLLGEGRQLVHHRVEGVLQLQDLAARVHVDLLRQVAPGHRRGHLRDVAHLGGQVAGHAVHGVGQVAPHTGDPGTCA